MVHHVEVDPDSASISPLPQGIESWLQAVLILGFLSFLSSVTLLTLLFYRLIKWQIRSKRTNQFAILIFNLLLADIQQSLAFLLNVEWVKNDAVMIESPICFVQGWLVSTGDLASGVWCFAIGLHTFASVLFDFRLKRRCFFQTVVALWAFVYLMSAIPVGLYSKEVYVRSGIWCWIHHDLPELRLWTHYIWIFIFEFGNVIVYTIIYAVVLQRIRSGYYSDAAAKRARSVSNLMVVYPIVYVVCTLPLASARMAAMANHPPSYQRLCLAGAMITSNGWLDVLLYTLTRRIMIFSDEPPADDNGIDTFSAFWTKPEKRFGGVCTVEAMRPLPPSRMNSYQTLFRGKAPVVLHTQSTSEEAIYQVGSKEIMTVRETHVVNEPALPEDYLAIEEEARKNRPRTPTGRWSEESANMKDLELAHIPD